MARIKNVRWVVEGQILRIGDVAFSCQGLSLCFDDCVEVNGKDYTCTTLSLPSLPNPLEASDDCIFCSYDERSCSTDYSFIGQTAAELTLLFG